MITTISNQKLGVRKHLRNSLGVHVKNILTFFDTFLLPWEKALFTKRKQTNSTVLFKNIFSHRVYDYFWKIILFTNFQ